MQRGIVAIVIAMCIAVVTANLSDKRAAEVWRQEACPSTFGSADQISFTVYLPMHEEVAAMSDTSILAQLGAQFPQSLDRTSESEKLAAIADMFQSKAEHSKAVLSWLAHSNCVQKSQFAIRCDALPADHIAAVLLQSAPQSLCRYAPLQAQRTAPSRLGVLPSVLASALERSGMAAHVAHIEGLALHDHTIRPKRHQATRPAAPHAAQPPVQAASDDGACSFPMNDRPALLSLMYTQGADRKLRAIVAPVCADGTHPLYDGSALCIFNPIATFSAQITVAGGYSALQNIPASSVTCDAANNVLSDYNCNVAVCYVDLTVNMTGYESISDAFVFTTYEDGTGSPVSHLCGWMDGLYNGDCTMASTATYSNPHSNFIEDIRSRYQIPPVVSNAASMSIGVLEWTDGTAYPTFDSDDVVLYMEANNLAYDVDTQLNLSYYYAATQDETTLDVELVAGLVPGATTYLWSIVFDGYVVTPLGAWLAMLEEILADPQSFPQSVWSASWTFGDPLSNQGLSESISARFRLLSLAGISVVAASGDTGAGSQFSTGPLLQFPDASPYCVSVGATALRRLASGYGGTTEIVCSANDGNIITSGGGYSGMFATPAFQTLLTSKAAGTGRGGPDVSALGAYIAVVIGGESQQMFGTSAAAPIVASIIALLNAERQSVGKSSLPLVHYFLYNASDSGSAFFNDVVKGDNCAIESDTFPWLNFGWYAPSACYSAGVGWDAVTGLGTPVYPLWASAAVAWSPSFIPVPAAILPQPNDDSNSGFFPGLSQPVSIIAVGAGCSLIFVVVLVFVRVVRRRRLQATLPMNQVAQQQQAFLQSQGASVNNNGGQVPQQHHYGQMPPQPGQGGGYQVAMPQ